jgi:hypothetical protein
MKIKLVFEQHNCQFKLLLEKLSIDHYKNAHLNEIR